MEVDRWWMDWIRPRRPDLVMASFGVVVVVSIDPGGVECVPCSRCGRHGGGGGYCATTCVSSTAVVGLLEQL